MNAKVQPTGGLPETRPVTTDEISKAFYLGVRDFRAAPLFGLFFGGIYAAGGLMILAGLTGIEARWLIFPVAIAFPLIGPFVAAGCYEVSRQLEKGEKPQWKSVLTVIFRQQRREMGWMAFITLFIFWMWMYQVRLLIAIFLGRMSFSSIPAFLNVVTTTPEGLAFLIVGSAVGLLLALVLFALTVISMPMLLDRDIDFITAMITSVRTVLASPVAMLGWGIAITAFAIAAMLPFFLGVIIALPILGHTTWHLYRFAVPDEE
jgi:uncharacterized membrane protein